MQDWAGWLLMLFSFSIVLMWRHVRSDTKVVHAIWFCLFLHHAVVLLNAYVGGVIGTEGDARTFHSMGAELVALSEPERVYFGNELAAYTHFFSNGLVAYTHSLGFFYRAFGASLLFGGELSVLAFALSCVVLVKLVDLLDLRRFRVGIVLFFGLLPSAIIFRSATFRESWQALFFLLFVYWAIRLRMRPGILIFSFMLMSALCLALLHVGLPVYAIYMTVISIYWGIYSRKKGVRWARHLRFLFVGLSVVCIILLVQKVGWFMTFGRALEMAEEYRLSAASITADNRALYGVMLDTSSVLGLVKTTLAIFANYMFAPFPWQIGSINDVYALLESMLRCVLLFFAVSSWRRSSGELRSCYGFLLIVVLCMEFYWALGTINWGTAIRHHLPGYSILVLLGGPGLALFMRELHFGMFGCRKDNTMLPK